MTVKEKFALITLILLVLSGCATGLNTKRVDPMEDSRVYTTFSATDLCLIAERMTQSLINRFNFGSERPLVRLDAVKNRTSEHIDTKAVTDSIRTELVKSGRIRFAVDYSEMAGQDEATVKEVSNRIGDKDREKYLRNQQAPMFRIYGELTGIRTITEDTKDVFYKFTLSMVDFRTGVLEWADEAKLRKVGTKSLFGQ